MLFENENCVKKLDSVGRIVIPKSIRHKANIQEGEDIAFFFMETSGKKYICLTAAHEEEKIEGYKQAMRVLQELGEPVPESLSKLVNKKDG